MRYFLHISYDGTNYSGWQWQPKAKSVQGRIENALKKIFKKPITVFGCGRTDARVHASQYFMHIELDKAIDFDLKFRLNKNLPDAIAIYDVWEMKDDQHTRYDAISRTYEYFFHTYEDPVLNKYSSFYELENLDIPAMKKVVKLLTLHDDFEAICKQPHLHNHTICKVSNTQLYISKDEKRFRFSIKSDRFLRAMIRLIVAFIIKVGSRELSYEEFKHIFINKINVPNKMPAFPNGLYLAKVEYPYLSVPPKENLCYFLKVGLE